MKFFVSLIAISLFTAFLAEAQLRQDLTYQPEEYYGGITHTHNPSSPGNWMNMLNMTMNHSYSMSFSSFGGKMQNLNAYTNSMYFDVSDKMNAYLDVSLLHAPFGNSFMSNDNLGAKIVVERARIDYQLSKNTHISLQFSQRPYHYSPFAPYGYDNYHSPYSRRSPWY